MSRMGRIGTLNDGSPITVNRDGTVSIGGQTMVPGGANVPAQYGGGNVQGKGLYFIYSTPPSSALASMAPGVTASAVIQFDQNSQFVWLRSTISAEVSGDVEVSSSYVLPLITLVMTDTGSGMAFMNQPTPVFDIAGTGQLPYVLPTPQMIQANASYNFSFANFATTTTYLNVKFQMHGYRVFNSASGA